jgi:hypothetical protein
MTEVRADRHPSTTRTRHLRPTVPDRSGRGRRYPA